MWRILLTATCIFWAIDVSVCLAEVEVDPAVDDTLRQDLEAILGEVAARESTQVAQEKLALGLRSLEARFDRIYLLRQLLIYQETTDNEQRAMAANWLVLQLMKKLNAKDIMGAIEPLLVHTNPHVRRAVEQTLGSLCLGQPPVEFAAITPLIGTSGKAISQLPNVILWMFASEPGNALLAFARTQQLNRDQWRGLLLAEHEISDVLWRQTQMFEVNDRALAKAKSNLDDLSKSENWWARLYVAEIVKQHRELTADGVMDRLRNDENELVRRVATGEPTE